MIGDRLSSDKIAIKELSKAEWPIAFLIKARRPTRAMSEKSHPYRTGIITSIVAAAIWSFFPGWTWTFYAIQKTLSVFTWRLPIWLIILFAGLAAFLIFFWRGRESDGARALQNEKVSYQYDDYPEFCDFVEDRFFGVVWRWSYDRVNDPVNPVSFCPTCDMQLVIHESHGAYRAAGIITTYLFCERCDVEKAEVEARYRQLESRIIREVQRKIRNDEYKRLLSS